MKMDEAKKFSECAYLKIVLARQNLKNHEITENIATFK